MKVLLENAWAEPLTLLVGCVTPPKSEKVIVLETRCLKGQGQRDFLSHWKPGRTAVLIPRP